MKYLIALSGPVASGKSALASEFCKRFKSMRISTRQLLLESGAKDERQELIETGKRLDRETDGTWVRDGAARYVNQQPAYDVILIDAVRTAAQITHLRELYGSKFLHIHVTVPIELAKQRYESRGIQSDQEASYDLVRSDRIESSVWDLDQIADRLVRNEHCETSSLLAQAAAGLGLFPLDTTPLVDVIVSGQYGSEGKGHICAHIAAEYGVLVRVGGPNAGHNVAEPKYNYRQLPSGTQSSPEAKILIAAGSTIRPSIILREIYQCGILKGRLVIDEQAMVIDDEDARIEGREGGLGSIGSTKQGAGAALARKILNRGAEPIFGPKVQLAKDHPDLKPFIGSVAQHLEEAYSAGTPIMLEGTQGTGLSIHHGHYPHVTARETTASGCLADAGIAPRRTRKVIMVVRSYPIRVGGESGPMGILTNFKTISDRSRVPLKEIEATEVGSVSGNKRRIAEFDWEHVRRSAVLNGATDIALTFSDYISIDNRQASSFDQLTAETRTFIEVVEKVTNAPVSLISTRFELGGVIDRRNWR